MRTDGDAGIVTDVGAASRWPSKPARPAIIEPASGASAITKQQVGVRRGRHRSALQSASSSSTLIVERLRNSTTRIARPMADSAGDGEG